MPRFAMVVKNLDALKVIRLCKMGGQLFRYTYRPIANFHESTPFLEDLPREVTCLA